jgi:hypothetical protein
MQLKELQDVVELEHLYLQSFLPGRSFEMSRAGA